MWRGVALFALLMAGFALVAPPHPYRVAQTEQPKAAQPPSPSNQHITALNDEETERAHRLKYEAQCNPGDDKRDSDLCAQWKAADAATDSARWTYVGNWIGGVSGLLVLVALGFAFEANKIARDTAKRQLRAYLTVEPGGINIPENGMHRVPLNVINNGQTPAYELEHGGDFLIIVGDPRQFNPETDGRLGSLGVTDFVASTDQILGPQTNQFTYAYLEEELTQPFWDQIFKMEAAIIHYGFFRYRDAFGEQRQTNFAFYHWGEELTDADSKRCRFGNGAT